MTQQKQTPIERPAPWFNLEQSEEGMLLRFGGTWVCLSIGSLEEEIYARIHKDLPRKLPIQVTLEKDCLMDTGGACLVARVIKILKHQKRDVEVSILSPSPLLDYFLEHQPAAKTFSVRLNWKIRWLDHIGYHAVVLMKTALSMLDFLGQVLVVWVQALRSIIHVRWVSIVHHAEEVGIKALPIISLISLLIGMVLSYQSINQLRRFGAEIYTIDFLGVSILREIAVLLTAIVVAGRSGSAFTAQIGTMALNQEIDAIRMLGLNPVLILVIPRLIALLVCLPILVFVSMVVGLFGGLVMTSLIIDVSAAQFTSQFQRAVSLSTFWVGMSKAPMFALLIGLVGCYRGFQVKGSAESVGRMTTQSVVESIFLVIVCDAFMSILFSYLKV